jgi:hypothetical protein
MWGGLLAHHLLQSSVVDINTFMMPQVLAEPTWQGRLTPTDLRALTPLQWRHVHPYGTFPLHMHERLLLAYAAYSDVGQHLALCEVRAIQGYEAMHRIR